MHLPYVSCLPISPNEIEAVDGVVWDDFCDERGGRLSTKMRKQNLDFFQDQFSRFLTLDLELDFFQDRTRAPKNVGRLSTLRVGTYLYNTLFVYLF